MDIQADKKYRFETFMGEKNELTIAEMVDSETRGAGLYVGGQIESLKAEHEKLKEILGDFMNAVLQKGFMTPEEVIGCIYYNPENIQPVE